VTRTNSAYTAHASLPLMIWLSPAFPVGSFAYSHALEWAVEAGDLPNAEALQSWLADLLVHGAPRNDAILLAAAWRAVRDGDMNTVAEANALALALAGSRERFVETASQGDAFRIAIRSAWRNAAFDLADATIVGDVAYPVAVGLAAAAHDLDLGATLDAYLTALVTNLTSAAIRLSVIGQTSAQRIVMAALPAIRELGQFAAHATIDEVGGCAFRSDIASMRHETQTTRLFRT
jgi:urease accessory protein